MNNDTNEINVQSENTIEIIDKEPKKRGCKIATLKPSSVTVADK